MKARIGLVCLAILIVPTASAESSDAPSIDVRIWGSVVPTDMLALWSVESVVADAGGEATSDGCTPAQPLPEWLDLSTARLLGLVPSHCPDPSAPSAPASAPAAPEEPVVVDEPSGDAPPADEAEDYYEPASRDSYAGGPLESTIVVLEPVVDAAQDTTGVVLIELDRVAQTQIELPVLELPSAPDLGARPSEPEPAPVESDEESSVTSQASSVSVFSVPLLVGAVATLLVAGGAVTAGFAFAPGWRTAAWKFAKKIGLLGLFSRLAQEDVLNHSRRSELLEFIRTSPGERVEQARRVLGLPNGSMHYHLKVLEDRNLVRVHRENGIARLFPAGPRLQPPPYVPDQRKRLLDVLTQEPGLTQRELAQRAALSERMISYHVRALATQGFVEIRPEGARKRLFLRPLVSA